MSSDKELLERWIAENLKRAPPGAPPTSPDQQGHRSDNVGDAAHGSDRDPFKYSDVDIGRMVELIEAASAKTDTLDLEQVETFFAGQAVALNMIFGQFTRAAGRRHRIFDSMRVALRAQAQCRATCNSLLDLATPPPSGAGRRKGSAKTRNSRDRNIESAENLA
jgi:hypothetical protein